MRSHLEIRPLKRQLRERVVTWVSLNLTTHALSDGHWTQPSRKGEHVWRPKEDSHSHIKAQGLKGNQPSQRFYFRLSDGKREGLSDIYLRPLVCGPVFWQSKHAISRLYGSVSRKHHTENIIGSWDVGGLNVRLLSAQWQLLMGTKVCVV